MLASCPGHLPPLHFLGHIGDLQRSRMQSRNGVYMIMKVELEMAWEQGYCCVMFTNNMQPFFLQLVVKFVSDSSCNLTCTRVADL